VLDEVETSFVSVSDEVENSFVLSMHIEN